MKKNETIFNLGQLNFPDNEIGFEKYNQEMKLYYLSRLFMAQIKANEFLRKYSCRNKVTGEIFNLCNNPYTTYKRYTAFIKFKMNDLNEKVKNTHIAFFTTNTLKSEYHPFQKNKTIINKNFNEQKIEEGFEKLKKAHREIYHDWVIKREGEVKHLRLSHIKVVEPHKTGVPHSHAIYYIPLSYLQHFDNDIEKMTKSFKKHWVNVCKKNDMGFRTYEHSTKHKSFVKIDSNKGNAISYLLKYVSKNLGFDNKYNKSEYSEAYLNLQEKVQDQEIDFEDFEKEVEKIEKLKLFGKDVDITKLLQDEANYLLKKQKLSKIGKAFWNLGWVKKNKNRIVTMSNSKESFQKQEFETFTRKTTYKEFAKKFGYDAERGVNFYSALWKKTYVIRNYVNEQGDFLKQRIFNKIEDTHYIMLHKKEILNVVVNFEEKQKNVIAYLKTQKTKIHHKRTYPEDFMNDFTTFYLELCKAEEFDLKMKKYENRLEMFQELWKIAKNDYTEDIFLSDLINLLQDKKMIAKSVNRFIFNVKDKNNKNEMEETLRITYLLIEEHIMKNLKTIKTTKIKELEVYEKIEEDIGLYFDTQKRIITKNKNDNCINVKLYAEKQKYDLIENPKVMVTFFNSYRQIVVEPINNFIAKNDLDEKYEAFKQKYNVVDFF